MPRPVCFCEQEALTHIFKKQRKEVGKKDMVKAIMHGCNGKMGQMITKLAQETQTVEIVAGVDVTDGISNPYPVFGRLEDCTAEADVIIDFASA